jgi:serine O-acetyltransferase
MRKLEYWTNCRNKGFLKVYILYLKFRYQKMSMKLGFSIPINCFEEGLYISHYGTVVINSRARIGKNCRIQEGINIGDSRGGVPVIGNNVYICTGAKVVGDIYVADDVLIGAQALVNKSITESGVTVAGIPAKVIGKHSSRPYLNKRLFNAS